MLLLWILFMLSPLMADAAMVTLAWDAPTVTGHDGYVVERKVGQQGGYTELAKVGLVLTYQDTTASDGQIICYQARSTLGTLRSKPSNEVCVATITSPLNLRIQ